MDNIDKKYKYKVATQCMTYNHANYIEDTLRGFAIQNTVFPVVYIVVDDASTDGEPDVIRDWANNNLIREDGIELYSNLSYGQRIQGTLKGNPQSTFVILLLSENYYQAGKDLKKNEFISEWLNDAKYHAICEGDDYWIDSLKLQKQVDLLEKHKNITVVSGGYISVKDGKKLFETCHKHGDDLFFEFDAMQWSEKWLIKTLTVMYRSEALAEYKEKVIHYKYNRDIHLFYHLLKNGRGIYLSEILGVYTIHGGGICSTVPLNKNALYNYQCNKELYLNNKDSVTRGRYLKSINKRLVNRMPNQQSFKLFVEGLEISKNAKELCRLLFHYIFAKEIS